MRRRLAVLHNTSAGRTGQRLFGQIIEALETGGAAVRLIEARSARQASEQAAAIATRCDFDAVIAAGGDGTFRAVATGMQNTAMPIGFVPLGTGNVLAHELGLPSRPFDLASALMHDPVLPVQGGLANGQPFFLMTGAGFDGAAVAALDHRTKRMFGRASYTLPVIKALAPVPRFFDVEIDGQPEEASWVIVSHASRYGGSFRLTDETRCGAGKLIAILIKARSRAQLVMAAIDLSLGRLAGPGMRRSWVRVVQAETVVLGSRVHVPAQVDGDAAGTTPVEVKARGPVVQVIVPPAYVASLTDCHTNHVH